MEKVHSGVAFEVEWKCDTHLEPIAHWDHHGEEQHTEDISNCPWPQLRPHPHLGEAESFLCPLIHCLLILYNNTISYPVSGTLFSSL